MTKTKKAYIPTKLELEGLLSITKEDSIQRWTMLHFILCGSKVNGDSRTINRRHIPGQ